MSVERSQGHEIPSFVFVWHSGGYFQLIPVMMVPTNFAVVTGEWTQGSGHCTIPPGWRLHKRRPRAGEEMFSQIGVGNFFFFFKPNFSAGALFKKNISIIPPWFF